VGLVGGEGEGMGKEVREEGWGKGGGSEEREEGVRKG
jgi:hypothetical protein